MLNVLQLFALLGHLGGKGALQRCHARHAALQFARLVDLAAQVVQQLPILDVQLRLFGGAPRVLVVCVATAGLGGACFFGQLDAGRQRRRQTLRTEGRP